MEITRKGLVIIGVITIAIISGIFFFTDMYIAKLDEQARENLFNPNISMTDDDIFHTPPSKLTEEQKNRLLELSNTDSTDPEDLRLAMKANDMLMRTMSDEDASKFAENWVNERTIEVEDVESTVDESLAHTTEEVAEGLPVDEIEQQPIETEEKKATTVYKSLSDGEYHDEALDDKVVTVEELMSDYGITEEDLINIPER